MPLPLPLPLPQPVPQPLPPQKPCLHIYQEEGTCDLPRCFFYNNGYCSEPCTSYDTSARCQMFGDSKGCIWDGSRCLAKCSSFVGWWGEQNCPSARCVWSGGRWGACQDSEQGA
uniref:Uncharacterized protein n=1 Tax=Alexandrium monilatum TaxID=311494 RepID=A0A7S4QTG1_9DINO